MDNTDETGQFEEWVTLREAERLTGVPVRTLRSWYGSGKVQSRMMTGGAHGPQRQVMVAEVQAQAEGRQAPTPPPTPPTEPTPPITTGTVPEGMQLVPLDAWTTMLEQLGNLHRAGQDLAEARERAGRAEATAQFQTERRHELERENAELRARLAGEPAPAPEPASEREPLPDIDDETVERFGREVEGLRPHQPPRSWWQRIRGKRS